MLVSIIIPCHNVAPYIADALESALAQTHRPIEIIAVDNNSTDQTKEILLDYQSRYPELIKVLAEKKQGAPAARNLGLKYAKGEWLQFLDADDVIFPEKIKDQLQLAEEKNATYVAGAAIFRDLDADHYMIPLPDPIHGVMDGILGGGTSSNLWHATSIRTIEGWDEALPNAQDIDLMMRLIKHGATVVVCKKFDTIKREREFGQISKSNLDQNLQVQIEVRHGFIQYLKMNRPGYYRKNKRLLYQLLFRYIRIFAGVDQGKAIEVHKAIFPKGFFFMPGHELQMGILYAILINLLGFEQVENLKTFLVEHIKRGSVIQLIRKLVHFRFR